MKKRFYLLFVCLLAIFPLLGNAQVNTLIVEDNNGQTTAFALESAPVITCDNGQLIVESAEANLSLELSEVKSYYFEQQTADRIESQTAVKPTVDIINGNLTVINLRPNDPVSIFGIDGKLIASSKAAADGTVTINGLRNNGVVIVRTPQLSFKILVK
ncbi:MAG: hypothetical protein ACOYJG_10445 [Prevotella sp.]|jgi:hypothetical protein